MDNEHNGETSRKKSSDEDTDRPLKKAKYLWQVKGKYHLKDNNVKILTAEHDDDDDKKDVVLTESVLESKKENNLNKNNCNRKRKNMIHNNNTTQTRNKNFFSDRSCIEAIIAHSDRILDFPIPEIPPKNIDKSISDEIPITLVKPNVKCDDYYLRKWQARQIAKSFVDNTINRVLEHWMVAPFDAADFVENCDNGGHIEDEGILMAIQSHGLQSGIRDSQIEANNASFSSKSLTDCNTKNNWEAEANCTCSKTRTDLIENNSLTPFHQRTEQNDFNLKYYENLCVLKDTEPLRNNFLMDSTTSSYSNKLPESADMEDSVEIDSSLIASEIDSETIHDNSNTYESLKMNDTDFLDAAVAVAIQKKGLTSFNCVDYG